METEKMKVSCKGDDWCALKCTAKLIGNKWYPVIIHRLMDNGTLGFNDLQKEIGGISNKVLSNNLKKLQDRGIVNRNVVDEKPVRVEYSLTEFGKSLEPLVDSMINWGQTNLEEAAEEEAVI